ncbi:T9SS C-terminal target domain-containing protein [uncultured Dysgonomonas sp.]|uniref:Secretion system C-terminal sorting domain-containing protein n=1 Tax=uncultured Dysgonomonas sp. TaxID=206096 RepID=A0A212JNP2_9BACT|nr:T9SS C-terminal target domain-containing protein [uncultured Dysgonomonas sp.]SBW01074.1 conserved hypothetical protein [uncultured Dysgonomonas sp.]
MKAIAFILATVWIYILPVSGQLNTAHNYYRAGDILVKQQVEYVNPGEAGTNKLWDFSRLKSVNDEYTLVYDLPPLDGDNIYIFGNKRYLKKDIQDNELIVGTEHNTMYYYRLTNDSLLQMGHENPSVVLEYTRPMVLTHFPLNYGQTVCSSYKSEGLYSGTVDIRTQGTMTTTADAYGKMILPSGDSLNPVLRVKTIQTIYDIPTEYITDVPNSTGNQLETCRWYSKGYRYPIFETIRHIDLADNTEVFTTAFFFPPQDHLYLDTDPENLALLDELWKDTEDNTANTETLQTKTVMLEDILTCRMYPNPVESVLNLKYELKADAKVSFELYSLEGMPVKKIVSISKAKGIYYDTLDCSTLAPKNYVLRIIANGVFINEIIIKK